MNMGAFETNDTDELGVPDSWIKKIENVEWISNAYHSLKKIILSNEFPVIDEAQPFISEILKQHGIRILKKFTEIVDKWKIELFYDKTDDEQNQENKNEEEAIYVLLIVSIAHLHDISLTLNVYHGNFVHTKDIFNLQKEITLRYLRRHFDILFGIPKQINRETFAKYMFFKDLLIISMSALYWESQELTNDEILVLMKTIDYSLVGNAKDTKNEEKRIISKIMKILFLLDIARMCTYDNIGITNMWERGRLSQAEREYCDIGNMKYVEKIIIRESKKDDNKRVIFVKFSDISTQEKQKGIKKDKEEIKAIKENVMHFFKRRMEKILQIFEPNNHRYYEILTKKQIKKVYSQQKETKTSIIKTIVSAKEVAFSNYPIKQRIRKLKEIIDLNSNGNKELKILLALIKDQLDVIVEMETTREIDNIIQPFYEYMDQIENILKNSSNFKREYAWRYFLLSELLSRLRNRIGESFLLQLIEETSKVPEQKNESKITQAISFKPKIIISFSTIIFRILYMESIKEILDRKRDIDLYQTKLLCLLFVENIFEITRVLSRFPLYDLKKHLEYICDKKKNKAILKEVIEHFFPKKMNKIKTHFKKLWENHEWINTLTCIFDEKNNVSNSYIVQTYKKYVREYKKIIKTISDTSDEHNTTKEIIDTHVIHIINDTIDQFERKSDIIKKGLFRNYKDIAYINIYVEIIRVIKRNLKELINYNNPFEIYKNNNLHQIILLNKLINLSKEVCREKKGFFSPGKQEIYLDMEFWNAFLMNCELDAKQINFDEKTQELVCKKNLLEELHAKRITEKDVKDKYKEKNIPFLFSTNKIEETIIALRITLLRFKLRKIKEKYRSSTIPDVVIRSLLYEFTDCLPRIFYLDQKLIILMAEAFLKDIRKLRNYTLKTSDSTKMFFSSLWLLIRLGKTTIKRGKDFVDKIKELNKLFTEKKRSYIEQYCLDQNALTRFKVNSCCNYEENKSLLLSKLPYDLTTLFYCIKAEKCAFDAEISNFPKINSLIPREETKKARFKESLRQDVEINSIVLHNHEIAEHSYLRALRRVELESNFHIRKILENYLLRSYFNQKAWHTLKSVFMLGENEIKEDTDKVPEDLIIDNYRKRCDMLERAATYFRFAACYSKSDFTHFIEKSWGRRYFTIGLENIYKIGDVRAQIDIDCNIATYNEIEQRISFKTKTINLINNSTYKSKGFQALNEIIDIRDKIQGLINRQKHLIQEYKSINSKLSAGKTLLEKLKSNKQEKNGTRNNYVTTISKMRELHGLINEKRLKRTEYLKIKDSILSNIEELINITKRRKRDLRNCGVEYSLIKQIKGLRYLISEKEQENKLLCLDKEISNKLYYAKKNFVLSRWYLANTTSQALVLIELSSIFERIGRLTHSIITRMFSSDEKDSKKKPKTREKYFKRLRTFIIALNSSIMKFIDYQTVQNQTDLIEQFKPSMKNLHFYLQQLVTVLDILDNNINKSQEKKLRKYKEKYNYLSNKITVLKHNYQLFSFMLPPIFYDFLKVLEVISNFIGLQKPSKIFANDMEIKHEIYEKIYNNALILLELQMDYEPLISKGSLLNTLINLQEKYLRAIINLENVNALLSTSGTVITEYVPIEHSEEERSKSFTIRLINSQFKEIDIILKKLNQLNITNVIKENPQRLLNFISNYMQQFRDIILSPDKGIVLLNYFIKSIHEQSLHKIILKHEKETDNPWEMIKKIVRRAGGSGK